MALSSKDLSSLLIHERIRIVSAQQPQPLVVGIETRTTQAGVNGCIRLQRAVC